MKTSSRGFLILAILWILLSLVWFLWIKNPAGGVVWLCAGLIELGIAIAARIKEKSGK